MLQPLAKSVRRLLAAVAMTTLMFGQGQADDDRPRGDLPPAPVDLSTLFDADLTADEAADLCREVHQLLVDRLGPDVISETDLWMGAVQGMIDVVNRRQREGISSAQAALPPSGMLLDRDEADRLGDVLEGNLTGVGIEFQLFSRPGVLVVSRVLPNSPAEAAGLLAGDQIVALDGVGFGGRTLQDVLAMLQGDGGSRIALHYQRGAGLATASYTVGLERRQFTVRSVADELRGGGVGYIRVFGFHRGTPEEVTDAIVRLRQLGADRFVLDLRNNVGGDLRGAIGVADLFVDEGTVLGRIVEPGVGEQDLVATAPKLVDDKVVILVNAWTRGAAEAVAIALQEHHRAYIIGEPTMGAARTETLIDLGHALVLRLDSVRLQTPTGGTWEGRGVIPDQSIWSSGTDDSVAEAGTEDQVFMVAVSYLETEGL